MNMKRILSLIMVLCMVMTMIVPGTALADTEEVVCVTAPQPETAYKLGLDRNGTVTAVPS